MARSSWVLIRLPLWPSAIEPSSVGGGVTRVADREVALERLERGVVEDLRDQAHVLVDQDLAAVADRDAGRLLAAVLQRVETEVAELRHLFAGGPDPEDTASILGTLVQRVERCGEPTVAARAAGGWGHVASLGEGAVRPGIGARRRRVRFPPEHRRCVGDR
jgi:hypothetical protein